MLKAMARSGVIRVCNKGMSSFGDGSSSSHRENQFKPSSLVLFNWRNWCNNALWWRRQGFYLICFGRGILIESDGGARESYMICRVHDIIMNLKLIKG